MSNEIKWVSFFTGHCGKHFDHYYKAEINGMRVEKHCSNSSTKYAIGNIDKAKTKYNTEQELITACKNIEK